MVLSPFDDPWIPENSYPNLPEYPYDFGIEREVTVLKTGQEQYNWEVDDFDKPKEEDLIIYEVLIRDFDAAAMSCGLLSKNCSAEDSFSGVRENSSPSSGLPKTETVKPLAIKVFLPVTLSVDSDDNVQRSVF